MNIEIQSNPFTRQPTINRTRSLKNIPSLSKVNHQGFSPYRLKNQIKLNEHNILISSRSTTELQSYNLPMPPKYKFKANDKDFIRIKEKVQEMMFPKVSKRYPDGYEQKKKMMRSGADGQQIVKQQQKWNKEVDDKIQTIDLGDGVRTMTNLSPKMVKRKEPEFQEYKDINQELKDTSRSAKNSPKLNDRHQLQLDLKQAQSRVCITQVYTSQKVLKTHHTQVNTSTKVLKNHHLNNAIQSHRVDNKLEKPYLHIDLNQRCRLVKIKDKNKILKIPKLGRNDPLRQITNPKLNSERTNNQGISKLAYSKFNYNKVGEARALEYSKVFQTSFSRLSNYQSNVNNYKNVELENVIKTSIEPLIFQRLTQTNNYTESSPIRHSSVLEKDTQLFQNSALKNYLSYREKINNKYPKFEQYRNSSFEKSKFNHNIDQRPKGLKHSRSQRNI